MKILKTVEAVREREREREYNFNKLSFICDVQNILLVCYKITKFNKVNIKRMDYVAIN